MVEISSRPWLLHHLQSGLHYPTKADLRQISWYTQTLIHPVPDTHIALDQRVVEYQIMWPLSVGKHADSGGRAIPQVFIWILLFMYRWNNRTSFVDKRDTSLAPVSTYHFVISHPNAMTSQENILFMMFQTDLSTIMSVYNFNHFNIY